MAGLFIIAGMSIYQKHKERKYNKEAKKLFDEGRYRDLQEETKERLARRDSILVGGAGPVAERHSEQERGDDLSDSGSERYRSISPPSVNTSPGSSPGGIPGKRKSLRKRWSLLPKK